MVLAELPRGVALRFQHCRHRHVSLLPAFGGAGDTDLGHAGAQADWYRR